MIEYNISRLMAVIFTPEFTIGNTLKLANSIQEITKEKFDGELISVPIPQEAPPEIPRFVLNSGDGAWKMEVSLSRTAIVFMKPLNLDIEIPDVVSFGNFARNFFTAYKDKRELKIQRMGFVSEKFFIPQTCSPTDFFIQKFFKESIAKEAFEHIGALELNALKHYNFENFDINSSVRIRTANLADESETPIVVIISDINTRFDHDIEFDKQAIQRFFTTIPPHINEILKYYI